MEIQYSRLFIKKFQKLPKKVQLSLVEKEEILRENSKNSSLKLHALTGKLTGYFAFSINYQYRVLLAIDEDGFTFIDVGTHGIYK